jgi:predicted nucleic acid-binding Zn ribbon protein
MARDDKKTRQQKTQIDEHQRTLRRNQVIFAVLALVLIISMVLSLVVNL